MPNPVGTKEGREELRRQELRRLRGSGMDLSKNPYLQALDGLDIAEELAEAVQNGQHYLTREALAEWDNWKGS